MLTYKTRKKLMLLVTGIVDNLKSKIKCILLELSFYTTNNVAKSHKSLLETLIKQFFIHN